VEKKKIKKGFRFMSFNINDLNDAQREAVVATNGPVLILAGAGSGKTRTLTFRIAYMIKDMNIAPENILAVTFTNKAAKEMKERIIDLIGDNVGGLWMGTFHSICARILRKEAEHIGYSRNFSIYDIDDQVQVVRKIIIEIGVPQQEFSPKMIQNRLSRAKNHFLSADDLEDSKRDGLDEYLPEIYRKYQKYLKANNALDFDDLLIKPIELFDKNPDIKERYASQFQNILVDEYQDTNHAQYLFLRHLAKGHQNICVVGDEDQSIYAWRGADINNILNFNKDYKDVKVCKLEENYRSDNNILKAANAVVKNNTERLGKDLFTKRKEGEKIQVYPAATEIEEAKHIVNIIHDEMYTNKRNFHDVAILYRTNAQSRVIEEELRRNAISYTIIGGTRFYDRKEIKDVLGYLKLIANPTNSIALKRIINFPLRGIGGTTVGKLEKFAEANSITLFDALVRVGEITNISATMGSRVIEFHKLIQKFIELSSKLCLTELVSSLASESGILHHYQTEYDQYESENRVGNIKELFNSIQQFADDREKNDLDASLSAFIEEVSLLTDIDSWNDTSNSVTLMTLHAAKGLEFPIVFITGLEMGLLPLQRNNADPKELEEERRLLYVGMTRAENHLYMSYARQRRKFGTTQLTTPSLFIDEIPADLLYYKADHSNAHYSKRSRTRSRKKKIQSYFERATVDQTVEETFAIGQKVYHAIFGKGEVLDLEGTGDKMKISVHFIDGDITKKLVKKYANLSPLEA
jgi:DNA helicase-2/ATP-dependent DNA helicase PcrA